MNAQKLVDFVNYFLLLIFLLCVAVQYNDPDPLRWMAIYGGAAVCCILFVVVRKVPSYLPAGVGLVALIWAFLILRDVWGRTIPIKEVFATIHMLSPGVEEVREIGGLLIVGFWMIVLFLKSRGVIHPSIR
jgi:Transmembrane family 220, helix